MKQHEAEIYYSEEDNQIYLRLCDLESDEPMWVFTCPKRALFKYDETIPEGFTLIGKEKEWD